MGGGGGGVRGGAHLSVITAITITGCSLLFLALLRSKLAQKEEGDASSSEGIKRKKKKKQVVRFSEDVDDPRGNGAEYRTLLRLPRRDVRPASAAGGGERTSKGGLPAEEPQERRRKAALCGSSGAGGPMGSKNSAIPANRSALYRGLCQYRSQMATLMLYRT